MTKPIYYPAIDGLRFLAFLFIFLGHSRTLIGPFLNYIGWSGVELFFLLSGFLLTKLLVTEYQQTNSIQLYKYFMRRILRIWPLYFIYLLAIIIISLFVTDYSFSLSRLLGNIFFYDNFVTAFNGYNTNLASIHLWSISQEEQYYLVLPFLIPWLIKQNIKKISLFITVSFTLLLLARFLLSPWGQNYVLIYVLPFSADSFLAGIILGIGTYDKWLKKINPALAFIIGSVLLSLLYFLPHRRVMTSNQVLIYFIPAASFFLIFISIVYSNRGVLYWLFSNKIIRYLGKISFGLYIFHISINRLVYSLFYTINKPMNWWGGICSLLITILLAVISYELVEKRFLKMKDRFTIIKNREI